VSNNVYKEKIEANSESQYIFVRTLKHCSPEMTTRKVELFFIQCSKVLRSPRSKNFN